MFGPYEPTPQHWGPGPHPFQDPDQSLFDAAERPVDYTGSVDPNEFRYQADYDAAVERANWAAQDQQRRGTEALRRRPPATPEQVEAARVRAEQGQARWAAQRAQQEKDEKAQAHRRATYCQSPSLHVATRCDRAYQIRSVVVLSVLPVLLLYVFGGAYWWHLPGSSFSANWDGGGFIWAIVLCGCVALLAWGRVAAMERELNSRMRKHMRTCSKQPDWSAS